MNLQCCHGNQVLFELKQLGSLYSHSSAYFLHQNVYLHKLARNDWQSFSCMYPLLWHAELHKSVVVISDVSNLSSCVLSSEGYQNTVLLIIYTE
jgi:hypothetical protein